MKITPVLFVDAIEPGLPFWIDKLGFTKTVEVPGEGGLAFVILVKDRREGPAGNLLCFASPAPSSQP